MTKKQIRLLKALNFSILDFFIRKKQEPKVQESNKKQESKLPVFKKKKTVKYKNVKWEDVIPLENPKYITKAEKILGYKFPQELIDLIKNCNGGYPTSAIFDTCHDSRRVFNSLMSFNPDDEVNIFFFIQHEDFKKEFKKSIPFAEDLSGDILVMSMDAQRGAIFLWDHEIREFNFVCSDLNTFLEERLYDSEDFTSKDNLKRLMNVCQTRLDNAGYDNIHSSFGIDIDSEFMGPPAIKELFENLDNVCANLRNMFDKHESWQDKNIKKWYKEFMNSWGLTDSDEVGHANIACEIQALGGNLTITMYTVLGNDDDGDMETRYKSVFDVKGKLIWQGEDNSD